MENIYKVRIRTNLDPRGLYPSERRYSASTVLGLGVIHLCFAGLALIFAALSLLSRPYTAEAVASDPYTTEASSDLYTPNTLVTSGVNATNKIDITVYITSAAFVMSSGAILAGLSALLAWKRWYIDNNIKWFFILSCASTLTSCITVALTTAIVIISVEKLSSVIPLSVHVLIASFLESIWSILSCRTSFVGMRNGYPDDIVVGKGCGKIEVNTVCKGSRKTRTATPDILSHFHVAEKFARYFPKRENAYLPKAESNSEYQERVRKFLSFEMDASSIK